MSSLSAPSGPSPPSRSGSGEMTGSSSATIGDTTYDGVRDNRGIVMGGVSTSRASFNVYNLNLSLMGGADDLHHVDYLECLHWLNPGLKRHGTEEATAENRYTRGTCEWFQELEQYVSWETGQGPPLLVLVGGPGMGKTFLCHFLKSRLSTSARRPSGIARTVTYYFCDYHEERSTPAAIVAGLLEQLLTAHRATFGVVRVEYLLAKKAASSRSLSHLWRIFRLLLKHTPGEVFLIIDGLDKCTKSAIQKLLLVVQNLVRVRCDDGDWGEDSCGSPVKFLLTSRSEAHFATIDTSLRGTIHQQNISELLTKSVSIFIKNEVDSLQLFKEDHAYRKSLCCKLQEGAGGIYLWAAMVLDQLRAIEEENDAAAGRKQADAILRACPSDLKLMYDRMLAEVKPKKVRNARLLLSFVATARRPFTQEELALLHLLRTEPCAVDARGLPHDNRLGELGAVHANCGSLLKVQDRTVTLVHATLQEHLLSTWLARRYATDTSLMNRYPSVLLHHRTKQLVVRFWETMLGASGRSKALSRFHVKPGATHLMVLQLCLRSLCSTLLEGGRKLIKMEGEELLVNHEGSQEAHHSYPALRYPMEEWLGHALAARDELLRLNRRSNDIRPWLRETLSKLPTLRDRWLHEVVHLGDVEMTQLLLQHDADPRTRWGAYGSILHKPAHEGSEELVRLLLDHDVDVDAQGALFDNALHAAADKSQIGVVTLLLKRQARVCSPNGDCAALHAAVVNGHFQIVELLLKSNPHSDRRSPSSARNWRALSQKVATWGRDQAQSAPPVGGDDDDDDDDDVNNKDNNGERDTKNADEDHGHTYALKRASSFGLLEIVQLLVKHKASINARGGEYGTALDAARAGGHTNIVQWLRENGAEESTEEDFGASPVYLAAKTGDTAEVQRLITEHHVDVNVEGGRYGRPLQVAAFYGFCDVALLLINNGADINATGSGCCSNALHAAVEGNSLDMVQMLLDCGVDANVTRASGAGPLHTAACCGGEAIVRLLLQRGANPNAEGGRYGHALQAAAIHGHDTIAKLLLDGNADPHAASGIYGNALYAAVVHSCRHRSLGSSRTGLIAMLLDYGADPNAHGMRYGYALLAAAQSGDGDIVDLLLRRGADVDASEHEYGSALHVAAARNDAHLVGKLISRQAKPGIQDREGRTPADVALANGHQELAKVLSTAASKRETRCLIETKKRIRWPFRSKIQTTMVIVKRFLCI